MTDFNEPGSAVEPDNSTQPQINQGEPSSQSNWEGFSEADKTYISDKGFKTPADILESYRNAEKALGTKISIPKDEDKEAWEKLYTKLGRPETADKYDIEADESIKADVQKLLFANGLSQKQGAELVKSYNALVAQQKDAFDKAFEEKSKQEKEAVIAEWGDNAAKNNELMTRGAKLLGLDDDLLNNIEVSIGTKNFMQAMKKLGEAISEDNAALGNKTPNSNQPMSFEEFYKQL